jgi:AcrR family transcriptional regulator
VYNYFGDRNGIVEAVYRRTVDILRSRVTVALTTTRGPRNAMAAAVRVHLEYARDDPHGYRFATGEPVFARLTDLDDERVRELASNFQGGPDAMLVARGMLSALQSMVVHWLDHEQEVTTIDHAVDVITAFLMGALVAADGVGVHVVPRWPVPEPG